MTTVFANFPVTDLPRSIVFYEALGFQKMKSFQMNKPARWCGMIPFG